MLVTGRSQSHWVDTAAHLEVRQAQLGPNPEQVHCRHSSARLGSFRHSKTGDARANRHGSVWLGIAESTVGKTALDTKIRVQLQVSMFCYPCAWEWHSKLLRLEDLWKKKQFNFSSGVDRKENTHVTLVAFETAGLNWAVPPITHNRQTLFTAQCRN